MTEPLVALVEDAAGDTDPLWLAVRLRAAADKVGANVSASSRAVADASTADDGQAYLDLVTQALTAGSSHNEDPNPAALRRLQLRSRRYLRLLHDSTDRLASLCGDVVVGALHAGHCGVHGIDGQSSGERCVLTIGMSRYVIALLRCAARRTHFTVIVAEDRPDGSGHTTAAELLTLGVPVRIIEFGAVAKCMAQVHVVLCGAQSVLADGGVLGPIGTLTLAHAARAHGRPLYVAVPQHKLGHTRHLDATAHCKMRGVPMSHDQRILRETPQRDSTPPQLVTLLLTDVGVLTASAVADEMLSRQQRPHG